MKADPFFVKEVYGMEKQLFAPLFQRPYVWKQEEQWEPLWRDIRVLADALLEGNYDCKPHFLGAVVLDQIHTPMDRPDGSAGHRHGDRGLRKWSYVLATGCSLM